MTLEAEATIYLVDDDPGARKSLQWFFESAAMRVESFDSAEGFLRAYDPDIVGCLVLDVRMPEMSGLELQRRLNEAKVEIPIIFISGHADVPMASRAFRAGAFDFVEKPINNQQLLDRLEQAIEFDKRRRTLSETREARRSRLTQLTKREFEVLSLLYDGKAIKQIASRLEISIQTAAKHRARVLEKLEVQNDVELVHMLKDIGDWKIEPHE